MNWQKLMEEIPFKMAPLSSLVVTRRSLVDEKKEPEPEAMQAEKELPDGLWVTREGKIMAECNGCGGSYEIFCDPEDFSQDMSYCGCSDRCIP